MFFGKILFIKLILWKRSQFLNFYHYEEPLSVTFNLPKKKGSIQIIFGLFCMKFNCNSGGNNYCGNTYCNYFEALKVYILSGSCCTKSYSRTQIVEMQFAELNNTPKQKQNWYFDNFDKSKSRNTASGSWFGQKYGL